MRRAMFGILALASVSAAQSSDDVWMCDAEMIIRLHLDDDGQFRVSEQKPGLRLLIDQQGITVYEYEGEIVYKPNKRFEMECTWHQNRPVLCVGDKSRYGRTRGRDTFELRVDNSFFLHQIGVRTSELNDGWVTGDRITVGRCAARDFQGDEIDLPLEPNLPEREAKTHEAVHK